MQLQAVPVSCTAFERRLRQHRSVVKAVAPLHAPDRRCLACSRHSRAAPHNGYVNTARSAAASNSSNNSSSGSDEQELPDIWAPMPPTPGLGRKRKVAALIAVAMLEITMTGTLLWSPVLAAVALAVLQPTKAEIQQQQAEAIKQAVAAAEVQAYRHVPVTPVEGAAWLNRLNQEMWATFWQPFLLVNNLSSWQDTVAAAAPKGWEVEIADVSIGTLAPQLSGFQAFADPDTGAVTAVDADMSFSSSSVRVVVVGRGPLGAFTAKVSAVQLEGHIRIIPLLQHRMLLAAFKQAPSVRVSLSLSAPLFKTALSPGDLGQLNFIQGLIGSAIKDQLVEPRRLAISLDSEISVEQAVATTMHVTVDSITGLPRSLMTGNDDSGGSRGTQGASVIPKVALVLIDTTTQTRAASRAVTPHPLRGSAQLQQQLSLELRRKQALYRLEVREVSLGPGGRVSASRGQLLGSGLLWVAAARDGTTLFWSYDRSGAPLATRWSPASHRPWQLSLPLDATVPGASGLAVELGVSVEPWVYKAGLSPGLSAALRTPGPRVVVLQVVEAQGLTVLPGSWSSAGPSTHIQLAYGQDMYRTSTQYATSSPIFGEVFAFAENPGILNNRIKVEVWQDDATAATAAAAGAASSPALGTDMRGSSSSSASPGSRTSSRSSSGSRGTGGRSSGSDGEGLERPPSGGSSSPGSGSARRGVGPSGRRAGGYNTKPVSNRLRHSSNGTGRHVNSSSVGRVGSDGSSGSSSVASHLLPDVEPESSEAADPDSHMLVDLELQDELDPALAESALHGIGAGVTTAAGSDGSGSSSPSGHVGCSLGSVVVELDSVTEDLIQDRWFQLGGTEGAAVRLRLVVVPGTLLPDTPAAAARDSSSTTRPQQQQQQFGREADGVFEMLSYFHKQLRGSSRDSVMVEVMSARLFLPLSSMDSSDVDQPSYVLTYGGAATVNTPPYSRPTRSRPSTRTTSGSSSSSWSSRPSGGASRGGGSNGSSGGGRSGSSDGSSGSSGVLGSATGSMFEELSPGNISLQLLEEVCLARGIFPLHPQQQQPSKAAPTRSNTPAATAAAAAGDGGLGASQWSGAAATPQPHLLKVLLFDSEDLTTVPPAEAASAIAAAAASKQPSVSALPPGTTSQQSRAGAAAVIAGGVGAGTAAAAAGGAPGAAAAPAAAGGDVVQASGAAVQASGAAAAAPSGLTSHPLSLNRSSSMSSSFSDIGGVAVDVQRVLAAAAAAAAAAQGITAQAGADAAGRAAGGAATAAASTAGGGAGALTARTPPAAPTQSPDCWEGWVKLDKDGGHLLLRLTYLPAAQPADLAVPGISGASSSSGSGIGAAAGSAADGSTAGGGSSSLVASLIEEEEEGLQEKLVAVLKQGLTQAEGQVTGAVHQLNDATAAAAQWINSSSSWVSSALPSWLSLQRPSSSSSGGSSSSNQPPQQQQGQGQKPPQQGSKAVAGSHQQQQQQQQSRPTAASTGGAVASPAAQQQQQKHPQQKQQQQGEAASNFLDLRFITRALGLGGNSATKQQPQPQQPHPALLSKQHSQQQQQQEQQQQQGQQQQGSDVVSHLLPVAALSSTEEAAAVPTAAAAGAQASQGVAAAAATGTAGPQAGSSSNGGSSRLPPDSTANGRQQSGAQTAPASARPAAALATGAAAGAAGAATVAAGAATVAAATAEGAAGPQSHPVAGLGAALTSYDGVPDVQLQAQPEELEDEF